MHIKMASAAARITTKKKHDPFYENLTMGVTNVLGRIPRVTEIRAEKRDACEKAQIITWEQRHGVYLPEDMKKFYLSCDGLYLYWSFRYTAKDIRRVGFINIPRLIQITLLRELGQIVAKYSTANGATATRKLSTLSISALTNNLGINNSTAMPTASTSHLTSSNALLSPRTKDPNANNGEQLIIGPKTKIFEWNVLNGAAKVCMLYETLGSNNPKFYLIELKEYKFTLLAETFTEYLRMSIVHLGLPYWELCFSSLKLPAWVEQLYLLVAPHLLQDRQVRRSKILVNEIEQPVITIDPNVFRQKVKNLASGKRP